MEETQDVDGMLVIDHDNVSTVGGESLGVIDLPFDPDQRRNRGHDGGREVEVVHVGAASFNEADGDGDEAEEGQGEVVDEDLDVVLDGGGAEVVEDEEEEEEDGGVAGDGEEAVENHGD